MRSFRNFDIPERNASFSLCLSLPDDARMRSESAVELGSPSDEKKGIFLNRIMERTLGFRPKFVKKLGAESIIRHDD